MRTPRYPPRSSPIRFEFFAKHDVLGAQRARHRHAHAGSLDASHGVQFTVGNDGHGGTKITLPHLLAGVTVASFFSHDAGVEHWTADAVGNSATATT